MSHYRNLALAVHTFFQAKETLVSRSHALAVAHIHIRGNRIAATANELVEAADLLSFERDSERASALRVLHRQRAAALGQSLDDFLDECSLGEQRAWFAPLFNLRARRDPDDVANAATVVLARIVEVLIYPMFKVPQLTVS